LPIWINDHLILASPRDPDYLRTDPRAIVLEAGQCFGTGTHPTTRMCLQELQQHLVAGDRVLDVGTGSGILALAAIRLGAGSAVALDRSLEACRVARGNVGGNGLQQVIEVIAGTPAALGGSAAFDVVVANLDTGDEVAQWLQTLTGRCRERGRVILSGFQAHAEGIMLKAAVAASLGPLSRRTEGQWVCLAFQRMP